MKSSSQYFPVEIISAEVRDNFFEDSYSLKPNNSADKTVEIALTHLHPHVESKQSQILLVHDVFQTHWQFLDQPFGTLVSELVSAGYSVWLMDWRSHGSSKKNRDVTTNHISEMAHFDLPAVIQFIDEKRPHPIHLVGIGYSAQMALESINHTLPIFRYYCFNTKSILGKKRYWVPGLKLIKRIKLMGKTWVSGFGTELEHRSLFAHELNRHGLLSSIRQKERKATLETLRRQANKIHWMTTNAAGETIARRHLKQLARINRVTRSNLERELIELIEKEHQG